jgi:hypothetical protein
MTGDRAGRRSSQISRNRDNRKYTNAGACSQMATVVAGARGECYLQGRGALCGFLAKQESVPVPASNPS